MKINLYFKDKLMYEGGNQFVINGDGEIMLHDPMDGRTYKPEFPEDYKIEVNFTY